MRFLMLSAIFLPLAAFAQEVAPSPDDAAALAKLFLDAVRGGNWVLATLAGLVLLVWLVRKVLVRIPVIGAFLATDAGGVIVNLGTLVPIALIGATLAGQSITWGLVLAVVGGPTALYVMAKKLLKPLVPRIYRIPYVGPPLASFIDPTYAPSLAVVE